MTTLTSDVIEEALIQINALDIAEDAEAIDAEKALGVLNRMRASLRGNGIGGVLQPKSVAAAVTAAQTGYQYLCNTTSAAFTITLPATPKNGARIGVSDAQIKFATNAVTIDPQDNLIEGARTNLVLNTDGGGKIWFFRIDTANWEKERDLLLTDTIDLPDDMSEHLISMLSGRLALNYGAQVPPEQAQILIQLANQARASIQRSFGRRGRNQANAAIGTTSAGTVQRTAAI